MDLPINLRDFEVLARDRLAQGLYDWYAGGAADEITLRDNEEAWTRLPLRAPVLAGVTGMRPDHDDSGPAGGVADPDRALLAQRAPAPGRRTGGGPGGGRHRDRPGIEHGSLIQPGGRRRGQRGGAVVPALLPARPRYTRALAERAEAAGYSAICLTVDAPVDGVRDRHVRNRFQIPPPGTRLGNLEPFFVDGTYIRPATGSCTTRPSPGACWNGFAELPGCPWLSREFCRPKMPGSPSKTGLPESSCRITVAASSTRPYPRARHCEAWWRRSRDGSRCSSMGASAGVPIFSRLSRSGPGPS